MNALDYLATLPAYVINLDRKTDRWERMQREVGPYVGSMERLSAVDATHLLGAAVEEFKRTSDRVSEANPGLRVMERKSHGYWRGSLAIYLSHIEAIEAGLAGGHETFLILEDDCSVRADLLRHTLPPPQVQDAVYVWGGALVGGSYTTHARRARALGPNLWQQIPQTPEGVRNRYLTHAIQMDRGVAKTWLAAVRASPQAYDISWWFGMLAVPTYVPTTEVLYQELSLGSDRSAVVDANRKRLALKMEAEEIL